MPENSESTANQPETESTTNRPESTASNTIEPTDNESTAGIMDDDQIEDNTQQPEDHQKIDEAEKYSLDWKIKHVPADTEEEFIRATHYSLEPDELVQALVARFGADPATAQQLVVDILDRINIEREEKAEQNYAAEQDMLAEIDKRSRARHDARVECASVHFDEVKEPPSSIRKTGASVSAEQGQKMYSALSVALEILSRKGFKGDQPLRTVTWRYFHEQLHIFEPDTGYRLISHTEEKAILDAEIQNAINRIWHEAQAQIEDVSVALSNAEDKDHRKQLRGKLARLIKEAEKRDACDSFRQNVKSALISYIGVFPVDDEAYYPIKLDPSFTIDLDCCIFVQNGIFNLQTQELLPFDCRVLFCNCAGFGFDPTAKCPTWLDFISKQLPAIAETLQLWFLYILVTWYDFEQFLAVIAPPNSGKGTIAELIKAFVGEKNCASADLKSAQKEAAVLEHKRQWLITDERKVDGRNNDDVCKFLLNVTGNEGVFLSPKYIKAYTARLGVKVSSFGNSMFLPADAFGGIYRRALILTLTASDTLDTTLKPKILLELAGVFNWALPAWPKLCELRIKGEQIPQPEASSQLRDDYQRNSNKLVTIMDEVFESAPDHEMGPKEYEIARQHARRWCIDNVSAKDISFEDLARALDDSVSGSRQWRDKSIKFFYKPEGKGRTYKGVKLRLDYIRSAKYNDDHQFSSIQRQDEVNVIMEERLVAAQVQLYIDEQTKLGRALKPDEIEAAKVLFEDLYKTVC